MNIFLIALIPASLALVFLPCLTGTHFLSGFDFTGYWYPFLDHAGRWFHGTGTLPFWIPQVFCGMPLAESLGPALYYPTEILCWGLGFNPQTFYLGDTILHLALAGSGAMMLARAMGFPPPAAAVSGLAYMLGGVLLIQVRIGVPVSIRCAALLPWAVLLLDGWIRGRGLRRAAGLSAIMALMLLTGGYQMLSYTVIALAVYLLFRPGRMQSLGLVLLSALSACALSAVAFLPNARYYLHSMRTTGVVDWGSISPLFFHDIPLLLFPAFDGTPDPERVKYLGLAVMALALVGLARKWRTLSGWTAILAVSFILALGSQTPAGSLVSLVPLLGGFRMPMKWMLFGQLSLALMAGAGAMVFGGIRGRAGRVFAIILPLLVAGDLVRWELRLRNMEPVESRPDALVDRLPGNPGGAWRVETAEPVPVINYRMPSDREWITGYHTAPMKQFVDLYAGALTAGILPSILPWMNARWLVASAQFQAGDRYQPRQKISCTDPVFGKDARYVLCEAGDYAPRAWLASGITLASSVGETLALLAKYPPSSGMAVVNTEGISLPGRPGGGSVKVVRQTPNAVDIEAAARNDGLLVLADSFYPAWEARVDGKRVPILRTNWIFRGVEVPAGKHRVEFKWNSVVFNIGLWLSLLSWIILASLAIRRNNS